MAHLIRWLRHLVAHMEELADRADNGEQNAMVLCGVLNVAALAIIGGLVCLALVWVL